MMLIRMVVVEFLACIEVLVAEKVEKIKPVVFLQLAVHLPVG